MVKAAASLLTRARTDALAALALAGLLAAALVLRLTNLDAYTGKFDEGIRLEQLLLMQAGFRPVREIFAAQGPLSLDLFYPLYALLGPSLAAARATVVVFSLLELLAVVWTARAVAGAGAGVLAVALLVASPLYLKYSRLALLEIPAVAPATLALGAALRFQRSGRQRWLILSAVALALALLIKPMVVGVAVPIGLALLLRPAWRPGDLLRYGAVAALLGALVIALYGPEEVWQQVVAYRASARGASDWSLRENWSILRAELRDEQLPIYALAIAGGLFLAVRHPRWGLPLAAWPLANLGLLLVYSPLQFKHVVILLPPLALVVAGAAAAAIGALLPASRRRPIRGGAGSRAAGGGGGALARAPRRGLGRLRVVLGLAVLGALASWYLGALPVLASQQIQILRGQTESEVETYDQETRLLGALSGPDDFIIVDDPIVAYNSRRKVPPMLVDPSSYRVRSRALRGSEVVDAAQRYDVKLLFLFSDGLLDLQEFGRFVDERYRAIWIAERQNRKDRAIYLRDDADFEAARAVVTGGLTPLRVDFGGELRLLGYNLARQELYPGAGTLLTLYWEALRPMTADYHVITRLRAEDGKTEYQSERGLGGGGEGTASWEPGRWVVRSQQLSVPARAPRGEYELLVALYDSETKSTPAITDGAATGASELPLARLQVRPALAQRAEMRPPGERLPLVRSP